MQVFKMFLLCLTVACASFAGTLAAAAANDETDVAIADNNEATSGSSGKIDEIVVTATKRSQSINSVGMTITAATGDALIERGRKRQKRLSEAHDGDIPLSSVPLQEYKGK